MRRRLLDPHDTIDSWGWQSITKIELLEVVRPHTGTWWTVSDLDASEERKIAEARALSAKGLGPRVANRTIGRNGMKARLPAHTFVWSAPEEALSGAGASALPMRVAPLEPNAAALGAGGASPAGPAGIDVTEEQPLSGFAACVEPTVDPTKIEVPYSALGRATGGIGRGELWYSAGRPGVGKTFTLCHYAAKAIKTGANVAYLSLEMPSRVISKRIMRDLASSDPKLLMALDRGGLDRQQVLAKLRNTTPGDITILDPSHGRATSSLIRELLAEYDLVIIDHVELMSTSDGRRAIDDWRAMAQISNQLKEDALAADRAILGAAQLNRDAESESLKAPKASTLSQSKALEEDGDVVVTMKHQSTRVMIQCAGKVREGAPATWLSLFDPENALFHEITAGEAASIKVRDDERQAKLDAELLIV